MADLAKDALSLWDDLEKDSSTSLRWMSGLLNFGDKDMGSDTPEGQFFSAIKPVCQSAMWLMHVFRDVIGSDSQPREAQHAIQGM